MSVQFIQQPILAASETDLVVAARDGSSSAFAALYRRHAGWMRPLFWRLAGGDGGLAEDLLQDSLVLAWQKLEQLREPERFGGLTIAASVAVALLVTTPPDSTPTRDSAWVISTEIEAMRHQVSWADMPALDSINDGLKAAWSENEQAIDELERALARNPDNLMLMDFPAQARLRQSELIHHATAHSAVAQSWRL